MQSAFGSEGEAAWCGLNPLSGLAYPFEYDVKPCCGMWIGMRSGDYHLYEMHYPSPLLTQRVQLIKRDVYVKLVGYIFCIHIAQVSRCQQGMQRIH